VPDLAARAYFTLCLVSGRLLRSARYSTTRIVRQDGTRRVTKRRHFYAPGLVWLGVPFSRFLDTGVRVLPQREWQERERLVYRRLHDASVLVDADGVLLLPYFAGRTLAALLDDPELEPSLRRTAIERAVVALAECHAQGLTHGDAMAENVLLDLAAGTACWFDFETVHDSSRPMVWRRADDVRALLATCLVRTAAEQYAETLTLIVDVYADEDVVCVLATSFASVWRRPLTFHLAQARLAFRCFREIGRLLREHQGAYPRRTNGSAASAISSTAQ
jgi:hypothetical protein